MNGLVIYLRAQEHIAYLRRDAERERLSGFAEHESFLARVSAHLRRRRRPIRDRTPARLSDARSATGRPMPQPPMHSATAPGYSRFSETLLLGDSTDARIRPLGPRERASVLEGEKC